MKGIFCAFLCAASIYAAAQTADPVVLSYQRNFIRASLSTKIELLSDATRITTVNMTPLYADAIGFIIQYYPVLGNDSQITDLAAAAATHSVQWNDPVILPALRNLFTAVPETRIRILCLDSLSKFQKPDKETVGFLNLWYSQGVQTPQANQDTVVLAACAKALGTIGDETSLPILFSSLFLKIDSSITSAADSAIREINSGFTPFVMGIIAKKNIQESYTVFKLFGKKGTITEAEKGSVAESVFSAMLDASAASGSQDSATRELLLGESLNTLAELSWSQASPLVLRYFYQIQGDYRNGAGNMELFLPVIRTLGKMATTEAAQALSIFLGLLNSETEQKKTYNEQMMHTVINALGELGDKTAFDYLLYVGYLNYPESVKKASRDALARLTW